MFIDKREQIIFSVFETGSIEQIRLLLEKTKDIDKYELYYHKLDVENDIVPKRGGAHFPKVVFFQPKSANVIVQYTNYFDGWFTLSNYISGNIQVPFYLVSFSNETDYKEFSFWQYQEFSLKRLIRAMQNPKWIFNNIGDILPFENADYYSRKKIIDRINKEIIIEYCSKLNLEITNDYFWESNAPALFYERVKW